MRLEQGEQVSLPAEDRAFFGHKERQEPAMSAARRAALDALEREFRDLLQGHSR